MKLSLFEMVLRAASTGWQGRAKFGQNRAGSARANWVGGADLRMGEHVDEAIASWVRGSDKTRKERKGGQELKKDDIERKMVSISGMSSKGRSHVSTVTAQSRRMRRC